MATIRPRRSVLYMPGSNARALEKGKTLDADALILDLEDAVAPDAKELARQQVADATRSGGYGNREIVIRVNGLDTPWGYQDLAMAAASGADAVLLPKVEGAAMVRQAENVLDRHRASRSLEVWCMMETPLGMLRAELIAQSSARVACFVMGTSDLAKELQARHVQDRLPMIASLSLCLMAARAFGLAIVDGVHLDLDDDAGFEHACRQGVDLGFDGKTLIHPKTIATANRVFAPSAEEIAFSRRIIKAHADAAAEGKGVVVVDGQLVENLHVANAERVVAMAEAIERASAA